jgi:hypothetical protein
LRLLKLASLDRRSFTDLLIAQLALIRAQWQVKRRPVGSLTIRGNAASLMVSGDPARASALALAVERASEHGLFHPFCLVRAIALRELLVKHAIRGSEIRVGVRRHNGNFGAHAWVRWGDQVLGDRPEHVATFTEVDDIRVLGLG